MAKRKPELRWDGLLTIGEVKQIASRICDDRTDQMAKELVDAYIDIHHAGHIKNNETVYQKLLDIVRKKMRVGNKSSDIHVSVINADYDIRCGLGNGVYVC